MAGAPARILPDNYHQRQHPPRSARFALPPREVELLTTGAGCRTGHRGFPAGVREWPRRRRNVLTGRSHPNPGPESVTRRPLTRARTNVRAEDR